MRFSAKHRKDQLSQDLIPPITLPKPPNLLT